MSDQTTRSEQVKLQRAAERPVPRELRMVDGESIELVLADRRCDPDFEAAEADRRREVFGTERRALTESLRRRREGTGDVERLSDAIARMARLSNLAARPISTSGQTSDERNPMGRRPPGMGDRELDRARRRIRDAIEDLEHALDQEEGIAEPRDLSSALGEHKDLELFTRFGGVPAPQVALDHPELGSRATIYRKRHLAGLNPLGLMPDTNLPPSELAAQGMARRVNDTRLLAKAA